MRSIPLHTLAAALLNAGATFAPVYAADAQVRIVDFMRFEPEVLTVAAGTTVTWTNKDGSNHIITVPGAQSGRLHMDKSWSHTFDAPGTIEYQCAMHPRMRGKIIVENP